MTLNMRFMLGLLATSLGAQTSMPVGIIRGDVVSTQAGELTIRNNQNIVLGCFYDARTYFERDRQSIVAGGLVAGDPVEVVADRTPNCYARTVQVVRTRRPQRYPAELLTPRGDMAFGGVVVRRGGRMITIKTRNGEIMLRLRPDTRYLGDGLRLDAEALLVNAHVFIRGGRNVDGDMEAYQVIWETR